MEVFAVMVLIVLIALIGVEFQQVRELRKIDARLRVIASLTRDTRSSQGSIGIHRSNGGAMPEMPRPTQKGRRHDVPGTGKQKQALKFERRGGEYERNRDGD